MWTPPQIHAQAHMQQALQANPMLGAGAPWWAWQEAGKEHTKEMSSHWRISASSCDPPLHHPPQPGAKTSPPRTSILLTQGVCPALNTKVGFMMLMAH